MDTSEFVMFLENYLAIVLNDYQRSTILLQLQSELEAQHRKTWALAIAEAAATIKWPYPKAMSDAISALPCPPIEETKDK